MGEPCGRQDFSAHYSSAKGMPWGGSPTWPSHTWRTTQCPTRWPLFKTETLKSAYKCVSTVSGAFVLTLIKRSVPTEGSSGNRRPQLSGLRYSRSISSSSTTLFTELFQLLLQKREHHIIVGIDKHTETFTRPWCWSDFKRKRIPTWELGRSKFCLFFSELERRQTFKGRENRIPDYWWVGNACIFKSLVFGAV